MRNEEQKQQPTAEEMRELSKGVRDGVTPLRDSINARIQAYAETGRRGLVLGFETIEVDATTEAPSRKSVSRSDFEEVVEDLRNRGFRTSYNGSLRDWTLRIWW